MLDEGKGWMALIVGLVVFLIGAVPIVAKIGILPFDLGFLDSITGMVGSFVIVAVGIYLLIDAIMEDDMVRIISVIVAILLVGVGVVTSLHNMGIITFSIPFMSTFIFYILFMIEGVFLIIAGFAMQ